MGGDKGLGMKAPALKSAPFAFAHPLFRLAAPPIRPSVLAFAFR